ncbi:hypothetical protein L9F63_004378 [Diploptera punctata]|uniref:Uncharacterized protein n=1 Tax=Diploptera punctata TaxID=6984 RepID=A0AAD7ZG44_DIPPU|nr:hypothetical protein L9F63_004378 [Diploptera punctata]
MKPDNILFILYRCTFSPAWEELEADRESIRSHSSNREECKTRRNTGAGTTTGLEVFMRPFEKTRRLTMGQRDLSGARVLIHHPSEFPEPGTGLYLPDVSGDVFTVKVSPAVTVTSTAVRGLSPTVRNCIFPDERQLTIYHTYTETACLTECRINFIRDTCGCTPYYFSNSQDKIYPECSLSQLPCIANHSLDLRFFKPPEGTRGFSAGSSLNCLHCLPTCHETVYSNPDLRFSKGYLDVYYKDLGVVKYRRSLMFDTMQLIVSFGGIAGLFLGVSLLTVVEFFYYVIKIIVAIFYVVVSWRSKSQKSTSKPNKNFNNNHTK